MQLPSIAVYERSGRRSKTYISFFDLLIAIYILSLSLVTCYFPPQGNIESFSSLPTCRMRSRFYRRWVPSKLWRTVGSVSSRMNCSSNSKLTRALQAEVAKVKVVKGSDAFNEALLKEKPDLKNATTLTLLACLLLGCFCQTMNGFDGSLFNGLTANKIFLSFFHGSNNGIWAGLVSAMYQIGGVCALPFVGPGIDTWGRRAGMFIGGILIVLGTVITGTTIHTASVHQFMGGRFLLGFGVSFVSSAGPIYVVETAHPAWRGIATAYCNCFWFTGSILASGAVRGALNLGGNISWQLPVWLQMVFPGLICLFCFFIPESPRWLYVHGKREKAITTLTKWHGYGNSESAWVKLQLSEYDEFLNMNGSVSENVFGWYKRSLTAVGQTMVGLPFSVQQPCKLLSSRVQLLLRHLRPMGRQRCPLIFSSRRSDHSGLYGFDYSGQHQPRVRMFPVRVCTNRRCFCGLPWPPSLDALFYGRLLCNLGRHDSCN